MKTTIIAEYRRGGKTVLLEKLHSATDENRYRVTLVTRNPSMTKAAELFLSHIPDGAKDNLTKQIDDYREKH